MYPFGDVAAHVIKALRVGREGGDRGGGDKAVVVINNDSAED